MRDKIIKFINDSLADKEVDNEYKNELIDACLQEYYKQISEGLSKEDAYKIALSDLSLEFSLKETKKKNTKLIPISSIVLSVVLVLISLIVSEYEPFLYYQYNYVGMVSLSFLISVLAFKAIIVALVRKDLIKSELICDAIALILFAPIFVDFLYAIIINIVDREHHRPNHQGFTIYHASLPLVFSLLFILYMAVKKKINLTLVSLTLVSVVSYVIYYYTYDYTLYFTTPHMMTIAGILVAAYCIYFVISNLKHHEKWYHYLIYLAIFIPLIITKSLDKYFYMPPYAVRLSLDIMLVLLVLQVIFKNKTRIIYNFRNIVPAFAMYYIFHEYNMSLNIPGNYQHWDPDHFSTFEFYQSYPLPLFILAFAIIEYLNVDLNDHEAL